MDATVPSSGKDGMAESCSCGRDKKSKDEDCDPFRDKKEAAPDKKLTRFAFKLAVIEKAASALGTMNFIWATAVLLGGFSQSLKSIDFWFVTIILVVEGLRISGRSGELATQATTWRSCSPDIILKSVYMYSLVIQEVSAFACIGLSTFRIVKQQYGSGDNLNRNRALNIFYCLSLLESSLTLLGFVVRSFLGKSPIRLADEKLITFNSKEGNKESEMLFFCVPRKVWPLALKDYGIDDSQFDTVRRFLYDTYSRCIKGNVFDGLKMDFLSYSVELLRSTDHNDQLMGARLLCTLADKYIFAEETLMAIGTMRDVVERLIEMLNWDKPHKQKIRRAAAKIICKLLEIPRNRIRVMAIPEFMESITSFLYDRNKIGIHSTKYQGQFPDKNIYKYSDFTVQGLEILQILANDPDNCAKIGTKQGLLCRIIELNPEASESEIVRHLKITPIETLASLVRKQDVRENIEGTSGFEGEHSNDLHLQSISIQA